MNNKLVVLILTLILTGCQNFEQTTPKWLQDQVGDHDVYDKIVIIPHQGCIGCIKEASEVVSQAKNYPTVLFVITDTPEPKQTRIEFSTALQEKNVVFDSKNLMMRSLDMGIYPVIFTINKQGILIKKKEARNGIADYLQTDSF